MKHVLFAILTYLAASQSGAVTSAPVLSLSQYLKSVESQSPDLQIEKSMKDESTARANGVRISPPMVGFMNAKDSTGSNQGIEISQEIPFPTKVSKEKEVRDLEAKAQAASFQYRKNEIFLSARNAYFEFWKAYEKAQILKEKRSWLQKHSKLARATARSDSSAQVHLMGIESEVDLLENQILENQANLVEKRNLLRVYAPDLKDGDYIPVEPNLEALEIDQKSNGTLIPWKENELRAAEARQSLKNQAAIPDLFIRYRGFNGNDTTAKSEEVMVGITLPFLFFWQPKAESSEAAATFQRAQAELNKARIEIETRLSSLLAKTEALKNQLLLLNEKLIPRAHKRMKLVENLSQRTMEGLDEHRVVMLDYLDLRLKALDVRTEYENSASEIMKLVNKEAAP